jgi:predicted O-methyltransferase YrrM
MDRLSRIPRAAAAFGLGLAVLVSCAGPSDSERLYYSVAMGGQTCGFQEVSISHLPDGGRPLVLLKEKGRGLVTALGKAIDTESEAEYRLDPENWGLVSCESTVDQGSGALKLSASVDGLRARVRVEPGGGEKEIPLEPETVFENSVYFPHLKRDFASGSARSARYKVLDLLDRKVREVTYTRTDDESVEFAGRTSEAVVFDCFSPEIGLKQRLWVDGETWRLLRSEAPWATLTRAGRSARQNLERANLDARILAPAGVEIGDINGLSYTKTRAVLEPVGNRLTVEGLNVPGQRFEGTVVDNRVEGTFEVRHERYDGTGAPSFPPDFGGRAELQPYLAPEDFIESDDAVLIAKATELTAGAADSWDAAKRLSRWVAENIGYDLPGGASARNTYDLREGECGAHSRLLAAFGRSVGIPARVVWGCLYVPNAGGSFGQHGWNEVYMGEAGWIPIDTTVREIDYADSGHIRLGVLSSSHISWNPKRMEILDFRVGSGESATPPGPGSALRYEPYLGDFQGPRGIIAVLTRGGGLAVRLADGRTFGLKDPDESGRWFFKLTPDVDISFEGSERGQVAGLVLANRARLPKKADPESIPEGVPEDLRTCLGRYAIPMQKDEITVTFRKGSLALIFPGGRVQPLQGPDADGLWSAKPGGDRFSFIRDESGTVQTMILHETVRATRVGPRVPGVGGASLSAGLFFRGVVGLGAAGWTSVSSPHGDPGPPTVEAILEKYIEALGGREALGGVRTRELAGELIHDYPSQSPPRTVLPAEVLAAAPGRWRLILKTSGGVQQMGYDGKSGWLQDSDRILIDDRQARSRLAFLFSPQAPLRLGDYFARPSLEGRVAFEGRAQYAVKATAASGREETLFFDAGSGLLTRLGDSIRITSYRREGGVLHPAEISIARSGGTSTYRFDDIRVNLDLDAARFAIPGLGEVFPEVFAGLSDPVVVPLLKDFPSVHEDMNIPCRDGRFLHDLIVRNRCRRGLEIGTFTGYSALWLGLAFRRTGGRLVTIEFEAEAGEEARKNILRAGLEDVVDARIADAFEEIPRLEGGFDFVFIDAWKPDYVRFLKLIRDRMEVGGVIVAHNVTNYARDMADYLAAIRNDPRLETTFEELTAEGMSVSKVLESPRPDVPPPPGQAGTSSRSGSPLVSVEDMRHDFLQLRRTLEKEHCCLYEYTPREEFEALFDRRFELLDRPLRLEEFFRITAPLAARVGCLHTALWMPGKFFNLGADNLFPLRVRLIENNLVAVGSYREPPEVPSGSVLREINGLSADKVFDELRSIASADASNPYFIDSQVEKRFSMFYASVFGFPDKYAVTFVPPGGGPAVAADLRPADIASVRKVVFANFDHPPLTLEFRDSDRTAVLTVPTFVYYDRVDYFQSFMDDAFRRIKDKGIGNLILDLRGNDGGDPFCAVILYSYLERRAAPYFAQPYGKYAPLAEPIPPAPSRFTGKLYVLLDGRCGSTNGHFCALLKYHRLGEFVGTPSGSTYKCNAGKNTEVRLDRTGLILTLGRSTYAAAVEGLDKAQPIQPDHPVHPTLRDYLEGKDVFLDTALKLIRAPGEAR